MKRIFTLTLLFSLAQPALSDMLPLLESKTSWDGQPFHYPEGEAKLSAFKLTLEQGQESPMHCHPMPTFGYILKGKLQVTKASGEQVVFNEGDAVIEVMSSLHKGKALSQSVEALVFYAGNSELKTTYPADHDHCQK